MSRINATGRKLPAQFGMAASMVVWGTIGVFVRNIPLSSSEVALFRALIALVILLLYQLVCRRKLPFAAIKKGLLPLCLSGAAMGFNWILLFQAYRYTTVSMATLCYYFAPVIVMVASPFLFHEHVSRRQVLCFVMATLGLVLMIGTGGSVAGSSQLTGILLGLGAAVLYASVILLNKYIPDISGLDRTQVQFCIAAVVLLPYVLFGGGFHLQALNGAGLLCLIILGVVHTGICYCVFFSSVPQLSGQQTAILSYLDPLVAILVSVTILGESMTVWQIIGGLLILCFTLYHDLSKRN